MLGYAWICLYKLCLYLSLYIYIFHFMGRAKRQSATNYSACASRDQSSSSPGESLIFTSMVYHWFGSSTFIPPGHDGHHLSTLPWVISHNAETSNWQVESPDRLRFSLSYETCLKNCLQELAPTNATRCPKWRCPKMGVPLEKLIHFHQSFPKKLTIQNWGYPPWYWEHHRTPIEPMAK